MLDDFLQIYTLSIVIVGEFNPVIVQPFWLAHKKLIREVEAQNAKVEVIHGDIVKYELDWVKIEITKNRFEVRTSQEPYFKPTEDLVLGIFGILQETPLFSIGINHVKYFALPDEERYYNFGNRLAPLSNWSDALNDARLLQLEIVEMKRKDGLSGQVRVKVLPSDITLSTPFGVLITMNDHFDFSNSPNSQGSAEILKILSAKWNDSFQRSEEIIKSLWSKVN